MMNYSRLNRSTKIFLFVFPFFYLAVGFYFRQVLGNPSLRSMDPDFVYFMSGLTLSDGSLKVGHIDHPGTPLQLLIALIFKITYLFRGDAHNYIEDVFLHPDLYLSIVNLVITSLTAGLLLYAGHMIYKTTRSVFYALLFQTAPFLPMIWYDLIGRVTPELLLPFPVILLTLLVVKNYFAKDETTNRDLFLFALVSAFGLSIKLTFLPFLLIPFIIINSWKKRILFSGASLIGFFIFAFPVTLQIERFWGWTKNLFLHSGQYGGGEANIVDFQLLQANLSQLYNNEKYYFVILLGLIVLTLVYSLLSRHKSERKILGIAVAVTLTIVIQFLMVGKHYAHHYFIPALMLLPLVIFIITEIIKKMWPVQVLTILINLSLFLFFLWSIQNNRNWLAVKTQAIGTDIENKVATWHFGSTLDTRNNYLIITSQGYGSPFIEYTLTYSHIWAYYTKRMEYAPLLDKLYPHTFNYFTWDNTLKSWAEKFDAKKIIDSGKMVYLYIERDDEELYDKTLAKLAEESETVFSAEGELLFRNEVTTEVIYLLNIQQADTAEGVSPVDFRSAGE